MPRPKSPMRKVLDREIERLTREIERLARERDDWKSRVQQLIEGFRPEMEAKNKAMTTFAERARVAEEALRETRLHCDKLQNEKARYVKLYEYEAQKSKHLNRVIDGLQLFIEKFANTCALDAHPFWNNTAKPE